MNSTSPQSGLRRALLIPVLLGNGPGPARKVPGALIARSSLQPHSLRVQVIGADGPQEGSEVHPDL